MTKRTGQVWIIVALVLTCAVAWASGSGPGMTADEALAKLMEGNQHYVAGGLTNQKMSDAATRQSLATGQKPYAIILSCSDSRVPPEIIFDKGLGEIFVVRVAGNVVDPIVLGSIEYAVEHLGTPLVVVLGHERCGAVTAAVDAKGKSEGNIGAIVKAIKPAVAQARKEMKGQDHAVLVEAAIDRNIHEVVLNMMKKSPVIAEMAAAGKVRIVEAKYDLDDGKVNLLNRK